MDVGDFEKNDRPPTVPLAPVWSEPFEAGKGWLRVFLILLLLKIVYFGGLFLALQLWPDEMDEVSYFGVMRHWPMEGGPEFASHFSTWDGAHYLYLSTIGYDSGVNSCAFYPLWPMVVRWFSLATGGNHLIAGLLLANLFSLVGWTLFYQVASRRFGEKVARWALVFLIIFPGSLFFQFCYSEPLFFLLAMLLWMGLVWKRYDLALMAAFLLPLSRAVGLFCVLPIAWHLLAEKRFFGFVRLQKWASQTSEIGHTSQAGSQASTRRNFTYFTLLIAPVLGWATYLGLMWYWTGNAFEGFQAQRFWGVHSIFNLVNLPKFLQEFFLPTVFHDFKGSTLDRCMFVLLISMVPIIWRTGKDMMLWTYILGVLPAMSGMFTSFTRYESMVFPIFIALAIFFTSLKRKWVVWMFVIPCVALHGVLLWRFVNFGWAG